MSVRYAVSSVHSAQFSFIMPAFISVNEVCIMKQLSNADYIWVWVRALGKSRTFPEEQLEWSLKTLYVVGLGLGLTPEMSVFKAGKCDGDIFVTVFSQFERLFHMPSDRLIVYLHKKY